MKINPNDPNSHAIRILSLEASLIVYRAKHLALRRLTSSLWQTVKPGDDFHPRLAQYENVAIDELLRTFSDDNPLYTSELKQLIDAARKQDS